MRPRLVLPLAAAGLALALAAPATAATSKCRRSSTTGHAHVVTKTSSAVVFTKHSGVWGCMYKGGPIRALLDEGGGLHLGHRGETKPIINGRYVAYSTFGSAIGDEFDRIVVWDLKLGQVKFEFGSTSVTSFVVKSNGSAAWTEGSTVQSADPNKDLIEVREVSSQQYDGDVLLDRGTDVDPRSLRLSGDSASVSWTRGGTTKTAPLR